MKESLVALAALSLFIALITSGTIAQGSRTIVAYADTNRFFDSVRRIYPSIKPLSHSENAASDKAFVNTKALKDFRCRYRHITGEKWFELTNGYFSFFRNQDCEHRVFYDRKGSWQYSLKFYPEDRLPLDIRLMIKSNYADYKTTFVEEIELPEGLNYVVHLDKGLLNNTRIMAENSDDPQLSKSA